MENGSKNAKLILLKIYPFSLSTDGNLLKPVLPGLLLATPLFNLRVHSHVIMKVI